MNKDLIIELEKLRLIFELKGETYKERAMRNAMPVIEKLKYKITTATLDRLKKDKEDGRIPGVGTGIMDRIIEFATHGHISDITQHNKELQAYKVFSKIIGVGPATIKELIGSKIYTLAALRNEIARDKFQPNHMQKLGIKYYDDMNEKIPRDEVTALGAQIKTFLTNLKPGIEFEISGSYRRGKSESSDIDIILTHAVWDPDFLVNVKESLTANKYFVDILIAGPQRVTFLYKSNIGGKVRQIDLLWVPKSSYWASVCYFTGNGDFNQKLRGIAKKKGYRLNQNGLYKVTKKGLVAVPISSEQDIFNTLGVQFIRPEQRV